MMTSKVGIRETMVGARDADTSGAQVHILYITFSDCIFIGIYFLRWRQRPGWDPETKAGARVQGTCFVFFLRLY